jgi:hypothetical protein
MRGRGPRCKRGKGDPIALCALTAADQNASPQPPKRWNFSEEALEVRIWHSLEKIALTSDGRLECNSRRKGGVARFSNFDGPRKRQIGHGRSQYAE